MAIPQHLFGVVAKIVRADEHIRILDKEIRTYLELCRDATQLPTKINPHEDTIRLTFNPMPEPSLLLSMIIGDSVHNARSALDHLWKRLAGSGKFPLFGDIDGPNNWLTHRASILRDVPTGAHAIIDGAQPCYRGKDAPTHPLFILNKLSNHDKHDAIHLTRPRSINTRFAFREKGSMTEVAVVRPPVVFHDQTEVLIRDVPVGVVKPGMDVNIKGTLFVSFSETGPWGDEPVQKVLINSLTFVKDKVFAPLVPFTRP